MMKRKKKKDRLERPPYAGLSCRSFCREAPGISGEAWIDASRLLSGRGLDHKEKTIV
jgi:hypothetical protein